MFPQVWAVLAKDLRIELRTREIVTTTGFFAALIAIMSSVAFSSGDAAPRLAAGAIWLSIAFASVLALGRTWHKERDDGAFLGMLVTPVRRSALFIGKALSLFVFVSLIEVIVVPLVTLFFHVDLDDVFARLLPLLFLGTIGVATTGTLFGAMTVRTRARELILASVLFPLLAPSLLSGVAATREVFMGADISELRDYFVLFGVFDMVSLLGGVALFGALVDG